MLKALYFLKTKKAQPKKNNKNGKTKNDKKMETQRTHTQLATVKVVKKKHMGIEKGEIQLKSFYSK